MDSWSIVPTKWSWLRLPPHNFNFGHTTSVCYSCWLQSCLRLLLLWSSHLNQPFIFKSLKLLLILAHSPNHAWQLLAICFNKLRKWPLPCWWLIILVSLSAMNPLMSTFHWWWLSLLDIRYFNRDLAWLCFKLDFLNLLGGHLTPLNVEEATLPLYNDNLPRF